MADCTQPSPLPGLLCLIRQSMNPQMSPCFARHLPVPHLTCSSGRTRAVSSIATQSCSSTTYRGIRLVFTPAPPPTLLGRPLQTSPSLCSVSRRGGERRGTDGGEGKIECEKGKGGEREIVIEESQHLGVDYNVSNMCACIFAWCEYSGSASTPSTPLATPSRHAVPPTNMLKSDPVVVHQINHTLSCSFDGLPRPTVTWRLNGTTLVTGRDNYVIRKIDNTSHVDIVGTKLSNSGDYECEVRNLAPWK